MPLVFVHGVSVRQDDSYEKNVKARNSLFRRFALGSISTNPSQTTILNPYWGDLGANFYWEYASLPGRETERFGPDEELPVLLVGESLQGRQPAPEEIILDVTRTTSLADAIDLLWAVSAQQVEDEKDDAAELALLAEHATGYAQTHPRPAWLNDVSNDEQFLSELAFQVNEWAASEQGASAPQAFGSDQIWDQIREAGLRIQNSVSAVTSRVLLEVVRNSVNVRVTRFLGDAFTYLTARGEKDEPGQIVSRIVDTLVQAKQNVSPDDSKLIVVGHSMGGNIIYDILTYFLPHSHPELKVDAFVTVGSQVGVFEEMKLFHASDKSVPADPKVNRVSRPTNVACWLNVFDRNDVLAFATKGIFEDTNDFDYITGMGLLMAHGSYFTMPSFHQQLAKRLRSVLQ